MEWLIFFVGAVVGAVIGVVVVGLNVTSHDVESAGVASDQILEPPPCPKCGKPKLYGGVLWLDHAICERTQTDSCTPEG